MRNIINGNERYFQKLRQVEILDSIVAKQDQQIFEATLALDRCMGDWEKHDQVVNTMGLRLQEKDHVIKLERKKGRIGYYIAGILFTYIILR